MEKRFWYPPLIKLPKLGKLPTPKPGALPKPSKLPQFKWPNPKKS